MRHQHGIIDADAPRTPHVKAVGDLRGAGRDAVIVAGSDGGKYSCDAAPADMDGDGDLDLVISQWSDKARIEWYENPLPHGDPSQGPGGATHIGDMRAHDLEIGGIGGDGELETATRNQDADGDHIVPWKRDTAGRRQHCILPCLTGEGLAPGDLTGVGRLGLVIGGRWYEATGDILADPWAEHVFADWPPDAVVKVADLNADGRLDVVLTRSEGQHRLSRFQAPADPRQGAWTEQVVDDDVDFAHGLVVADLTGDGRTDIVTAEMHQSRLKRVLAYSNLGDGTWERNVLAETGSHNLCVGDVPGTGTPAIIGAKYG